MAKNIYLFIVICKYLSSFAKILVIHNINAIIFLRYFKKLFYI